MAAPSPRPDPPAPRVRCCLPCSLLPFSSLGASKALRCTSFFAQVSCHFKHLLASCHFKHLLAFYHLPHLFQGRKDRHLAVSVSVEWFAGRRTETGAYSLLGRKSRTVPLEIKNTLHLKNTRGSALGSCVCAPPPPRSVVHAVSPLH